MEVYFCPLLHDPCRISLFRSLFCPRSFLPAVVTPSGLSPNLMPSVDSVQEGLGGEEREAGRPDKASKKSCSKRGRENGVEVGRQCDDVLPLKQSQLCRVSAEGNNPVERGKLTMGREERIPGVMSSGTTLWKMPGDEPDFANRRPPRPHEATRSRSRGSVGRHGAGNT